MLNTHNILAQLMKTYVFVYAVLTQISCRGKQEGNKFKFCKISSDIFYLMSWDKKVTKVTNDIFFYYCAPQEFYISGGDGLPRGTVENLLSRVRPVINLHGCEVGLPFLHPSLLFSV